MPVQTPEAFPGARRYIESIKLELAANVKAIKGEFAVTDNGRYAEPGKTDADIAMMLGRFADTVDNTGGAAGDKSVVIRLLNGFFADGFLNDGTSPVDADDLWVDVYLKDAKTISADGTGRTVVGKLVFIDDDGMCFVKLAGGM